jgi:ATP-dependent Clp protease ATP-binding subunit ClpA
VTRHRIRHRIGRLLWAVIGDDRVGAVHARFDADAREVMRLANTERRRLGHPVLADEHILLGLLRHGTSPAAAVLTTHGLDLESARADLLAVGPTLAPKADPATALRAVGIDIDQIRQRLEATFGPGAVRAAERRVRRRPWWRGGHSRPSPLCGYLLAKRALHFAGDRAADEAGDRGDVHVTPQHLLYGLLRDAQDPLGTQLSRRGLATLAALGWTPGRPNPLRLLLQVRGVDLGRLATEVSGPPR